MAPHARDELGFMERLDDEVDHAQVEGLDPQGDVFEVPNSVRALSPMDPLGSTMGFNNTDPQGNPTSPVVNRLVNFGWEYVYHCHILSHEEMDMMRPVSLALPPLKPLGLTFAFTGNGNNRRVRLTWTDNSITETSFLVQRTTDGTTWTDVGSVQSPLEQVNTKGGTRQFVDTTSNATTPYRYRVQAVNTVGYGAEFPSLSVQAASAEVGVNTAAAPTQLVGTLQAGPRVALTWRDNASNESRFVVERSADGGATFTQLATVAARNGTGNVTFTDTSVSLGSTYQYRVAAANAAGASAPSNTLSITVAVPAAPTNVVGTARRQGNGERVTLTWADLTNETGYTLQWSTTAAFTTVSGTGSTTANTTTFTTGTITRQTWFFRVRAANVLGTSAWSAPLQVTAP